MQSAMRIGSLPNIENRSRVHSATLQWFVKIDAALANQQQTPAPGNAIKYPPLIAGTSSIPEISLPSAHIMGRKTDSTSVAVAVAVNRTLIRQILGNVPKISTSAEGSSALPSNWGKSIGLMC